MVYNIGEKDITTYKDILISFLEYAAKINYIDRYKLYRFDEILKDINWSQRLNIDNRQIRAIYELLKNI